MHGFKFINNLIMYEGKKGWQNKRILFNYYYYYSPIGLVAFYKTFPYLIL